MKKLLIVAVASLSFCSAFAQSDQDWRISLGWAARGSMRSRLGPSSKMAEIYGMDLDFQYKLLNTENFNVWFDVGGSFMPNRRLSRVANYNGEGNTRSMHLQYEELRLMFVPECKITENWNIGARLGLAMDWMESSVRINGDKAYNDFNRFLVQAIIGLQTSYMFTNNLGLYANLDYRCGPETKFNRGGEDFGFLRMNGWYAGIGLLLQF